MARKEILKHNTLDGHGGLIAGFKCNVLGFCVHVLAKISLTGTVLQT